MDYIKAAKELKYLFFVGVAIAIIGIIIINIGIIIINSKAGAQYNGDWSGTIKQIIGVFNWAVPIAWNILYLSCGFVIAKKFKASTKQAAIVGFVFAIVAAIMRIVIFDIDDFARLGDVNVIFDSETRMLGETVMSLLGSAVKGAIFAYAGAFFYHEAHVGKDRKQ